MSQNPNPETSEAGGNKDENVRRMGERLEALEAEVKELRPYKHREMVRMAGWDPKSGEGKALSRDLEMGLVEAESDDKLPEALTAYAEQEYTWKPPQTLTPTEQTHVEAGARQTEMQQQTTSPPPNDDRTDYERRIQAARDEGNFVEASRLQLEYERKTKGK